MRTKRELLLPPLIVIITNMIHSNFSMEIHRVACAPTEYSFNQDYSPAPNLLRLNCQDTFQTNGRIAITKILYTRTSGCWVPGRNFTCYDDARENTALELYSQDVLEANGLGFHEVAIQPYFSSECIATSNHVVVHYMCRDSRERWNMCDSFSRTSYQGVDMTTPRYPGTTYVDGPEPYLACLCTASVPSYADLVVSTYDTDFRAGPGGLCDGEEFFQIYLNGTESVEVFRLIHNGQHPCSYGFRDTGNYTEQNKSVSVVYYLDDISSYGTGRGAWFGVKGIAPSTGQPSTVTVECSQLFDPSVNSGSGDSSVTTTIRSNPFTTPRSPSKPSVYPSTSTRPPSATTIQTEKINSDKRSGDSTGYSDGIHRIACAPTESFKKDPSSAPNLLRLNCQDTFQSNGRIAVTKILYTRTSSCWVPVSNVTCFDDVKVGGLSELHSNDILGANGLDFYEITVQPYFSSKCRAKSTYVVVEYICRDSGKRYSMCDTFSRTSYTDVDITTPFYPDPMYTTAPEAYLACLCTANVPSYVDLVITTYDIDFHVGQSGLCDGEEFFKGDFSGMGLYELFMMIHSGQHQCSYSFRNIGNRTEYRRSMSFVYYSDFIYETRHRRGAWLGIKGIASSTGQPTVVNVKCSQIFDPFDPTGSGSINSPSPVTPTVSSGTKTSKNSFTATATRWQSTQYPSPSTKYPFSSTNSPVEKIEPGGKGDNSTGIIVGVSIAGLVVLAIFAAAVFMCLKRRSLNDVPETDTKGTISHRKPTLPPRNIGMKSSVKSHTSSMPEYFEPLEESIYCIPEDEPCDTEQYEPLQGVDNPAMNYTKLSAPTSIGQSDPTDGYAVLEATAPPAELVQEYLEPCVNSTSTTTQEKKRTLVSELSNAYDTVVPDYDNTKLELEAKMSDPKYYNLTDCTSKSDQV